VFARLNLLLAWNFVSDLGDFVVLLTNNVLQNVLISHTHDIFFLWLGMTTCLIVCAGMVLHNCDTFLNFYCALSVYVLDRRRCFDVLGNGAVVFDGEVDLKGDLLIG
jgi:hypothetical protein